MTEQQLQSWEDGTLIQEACPDLSPSEREFIVTGITDDEWDTAFSEDRRVQETYRS